MSSEVLRRAASELRENAEKSGTQPQTAAHITGVWLNGRFHAAISADTASALADLLDIAATHQVGFTPVARERITAVARAYLGESA